MNLSIEFRDGVLWATVTGRVSLAESKKMCAATCDAAVDLGVGQILVDVSAADGELSELDRYQLGQGMANYYITKTLAFTVAIVGKPPLVTGFSALVASNRGVTAETFSDTTRAVYWLNRFSPSEV